MKSLYRFLTIVAVFALVSVPAVSAQDDREYNPQTDSQIGPDNDAALPEQPEVNSSAQYPQTDDQQQLPDPPARAARLQYASGSVSVQPHGTDDWVAGALNRPLTIADNIWADKNSRAEISVGTGLIRIDSESSLTLSNVDENMVQLQLHQGAMYLHVRRLYAHETYEVDTPDQAFTVRKPGDYRFDVDPNDDRTVITVWSGEGESTGDGPTVRIRENQQVVFNGRDLNSVQTHRTPGADGFDEWAQARDHRFDHSTSARYVSPDVVGADDLDEYGSWRNTPDYGDVWVPSRVDAGWAPYRNGHWIWVAPWGWTWVEDEPWGYAPFHYGRWVYYNNYWGWAPGPVWVRPYYAPALVAWFGGPAWGVSVSFGGENGYGWCPLGFGEPYIPWYGVSRGYFNTVNITNTRITNVNITNVYNNTYHHGRQGDGRGGNGWQGHYANMRAPGGFTAVNRDTLVNSRNVSKNVVNVSPTQITKVTVNNNINNKINVNVRPTKVAMLGPNAGKQAAIPPQRSFTRPVVAHATPPAGFSRGGAAEKPNGGFNRVGAANNGGFNRGGGSPALGHNQRGQSDMQRARIPGPSISNRQGGPNSNMRLPEAQPRAVPHPPSAGVFGEHGMNSRNQRPNSTTPGGRGENQRDNRPSNIQMPTARRGNGGAENQGRPEMAFRTNVPRPPSAGMSRGEGPRGEKLGTGNASRMQGLSNSAPRGMDRSSAPVPRANGRPAVPSRGNFSPRGEMNTLHPPSPSPRGYSSAAARGSFGGGNTRYEAPRPSPSEKANYRPNYGHPSYSRPAASKDHSYSRPAPSYGGGSHDRPAPAYSRPAPSYSGGSQGRAMSSYGGNGAGKPQAYAGGGFGGGRAPSYGGGDHASERLGGSRPSGGFRGGGHASGGAGGHASAPSDGGGHSSGGAGRHNRGGYHDH